MRLWPLSFPEHVQVAERYRRSRQYGVAQDHYEQAAAAAAPARDLETEMLRRAWCCCERTQGRVSELEG